MRRVLASGVVLALAGPTALAAVAIAPGTIPEPVTGQPYTLSFTASGGIATYAFFATGGRLPSGLAMGVDGRLAGTPAAPLPYAFNVHAFDANGRAAQQTYSGDVASTVPVADPQSVSTREDQAVAINLTAHDPGDPVLAYSIIEPPAHGTLGGSDAARTYTPAPDYFGPDAFQFVASDGTHQSAPALVSITVTPVNDAPSFTAGGSVAVPRDSGPVTRPGWAGALSAGPANESAQSAVFAVTTNTQPALFTAGPVVAPDGTLTFTPSGQAGKSVVCVEARDDGGVADGGVDRSAPQCFALVLQTPGTDLSIAITAPPAFVDGNALAFTVRVANAGPTAASDAPVDVALPPELVSATWSCTPGAGADCAASGTGAIADSVDLPVNGAVDYTVTATVAAHGADAFAVTATVAAGPAQEDPDPSDNTDQHAFRLDAIFADGFED